LSGSQKTIVSTLFKNSVVAGGRYIAIQKKSKSADPSPQKSCGVAYTRADGTVTNVVAEKEVKASLFQMFPFSNKGPGP
jgi:hypothetical protein